MTLLSSDELNVWRRCTTQSSSVASASPSRKTSTTELGRVYNEQQVHVRGQAVEK